MAGIRALRKIELGRETTAGTAATPTTIWRGQGTIEDSLELVFPEEDVGYLSGITRTYIPQVEATLEMDEVEATFEQLPHILEAGVQTDTPAQNGTGSGYIYTYTFPTTAAKTLKHYTIAGGDNQQAEYFAYGFVESFSLSGSSGEAVMMGATWKGRQVATTTFTTTASIPTVETLLFNKSNLYIDTAGGTMGGTVKSNTLLGFTLDVDTGWQAVYAGDGQLYFSFDKSTMPEVTMDVTFEHDATAVAEIAAWRAETVRQIRIKVTGAGLTTVGGGTYTTKQIWIDLAGKWESFDPIDEQDGNDVVTGTFRARYDATAAKFAEITVINELSALP
jgi:hypothetical protein